MRRATAPPPASTATNELPRRGIRMEQRKNPKEFDKKIDEKLFLIFIKNSRKLKKVLFFEIAFFYKGKSSSKIDRF